MRRSIYVPLALILAVASVVAIVKAQEWKQWAPPAQTAAPAMIHNPTMGPRGAFPERAPLAERLNRPQQSTPPAAQEPNRISVTPEGKLPSPAASADDWAALHAPPQVEEPSQEQRFPEPARRESFAPALPPLRVDNPFFNEHDAPVRPAQAVAGAAAAQTSTADAAAAPIATPRPTLTLAQPTAIAAPAASNKAESIAEPTSSRRTKPLAEPAPRFIQRDARPSAPTAKPQEPQSPQPQEKPALGSVLFTAEAPVLSVRTAGPPTIVVGKTAAYVIEIANTGTADADDVAVLIDLPPWAEVAATDATSGAARLEAVVGDSGRIKWTIYQLAANQREQLTLKIIPRQSRAIDLAVNWTYAPKSRTAQIEVQEPKLELLLSGPQDVLFGETKTYTITIANPGSGPAENVTLQLLPITAGQESAGVSQIGTIEAGGRRAIEIELTARQSGDIELRALASGDSGLRSEAGQVIHVRRGALEIVAAGPPMKYAGTTAAYQVRVANTGDAAASGVIVEAVLPRGAEFTAASEGGAYRQEQGRVQWQIGSLRPGATRVLEMRCALAEAGSNRIEFLASGSDDLSNVTSCVTRVEALADLKLEINDPPGPVPAGEPMVYQVTLVNRGTKAAERVQIHAIFSDGIEPLAVEGGAAELHIGQVAFQTIDRIVAGQQLTLKITAKAQVAGNHTFGVQVSCADPQTQLSAQETTRFYDNAGADTNQPTSEAALPPRLDPRR